MRALPKRVAVITVVFLLMTGLGACSKEERALKLEKDFPNAVIEMEEVGISDGQPDYSVYVSALETAISEKHAGYQDYGILYDLNSDGIGELFLIHTYQNSNNFPVKGFSVYDIENGALVPRAEKRDLMILAGGGNVFAGMVDFSGQKQFYTFALQIGDVFADAKIDLYDAEIALKRSFECNMLSNSAPFSTEDSTCSYQIDGRNCSEDEYMEMLTATFPFDPDVFSLSNDESQKNGSRFFDGRWSGDTLAALLNRLQGDGDERCLDIDREASLDTERDDIQASELYGNWKIDEQKTMETAGVGMTTIFGTAYKYENKMEIGENNSFFYVIATGIGGAGSWSLEGNCLTYNITNYEQGTMESAKLEVQEHYLIMKYFEYDIYWGKE